MDAVRMHRTTHSRAGFTLIESVIAMGIFVILSISLITAVSFAFKTTRNMPYEVFASQAISGRAEELLKADYDSLKIDGLSYKVSTLDAAEDVANGDPADGKKIVFIDETIDFDPDAPDAVPDFRIQVKFEGFGNANGANSGTTLGVAGDPGWAVDQWAGYIVAIKGGPGRGQAAYVKSNTVNRLTVTRNLDGTGAVGWTKTPVAADYFEIGGGKKAVVSCTWDLNDKIDDPKNPGTLITKTYTRSMSQFVYQLGGS